MNNLGLPLIHLERSRNRIVMAEMDCAPYHGFSSRETHMLNADTSQQRHFYFMNCVAVVAAMLYLASAVVAQTTAPAQPENPLVQEMAKYPGLMPEFGQLLEKLQHGIQLPPPRSESHLLPLLPESTLFYAAIPNYGDASHQALTIFQQELKQSPVLRAWWQHGELGTEGPKVEDSLEKFSQLCQYLGDEIVVSGAIDARHNPNLLVLAEVMKPGLKNFLQQVMKDRPAKSQPQLRLFDVQELATARDTSDAKQLVILLRSDLLVAALDVAALRSLNDRVDRSSRQFVSAPFGQRLAKAYDGGVTTVAGADLQKILKQFPPGSAENQLIFKRTGFADMKYVVWDHKSAAGAATSQMELSFTGPRHGVASWLAAPGPMGGLDFISPKAIVTSSILLKSPAAMYDDLQGLFSASNPNAFAGIAQMEKGLGVNLRDDVLSHLAGEVTFELDSLQPDPAWKALLQVNAPGPLEATLGRLLANMPVSVQQSEQDGVTYYIVRIPSAQKPFAIAYAFVDGYLIVASNRAGLVEAVRVHRSGQSLAKSSKFLASLPPGNSQMSGLLYEDPIAIAALTMQNISPEIAGSLSHTTVATPPVMVTAYGDESAIRQVSQSASFDAGAALVVAAIAVPNLLRARIAANESSAVANVRTTVTAQVMYSTAYPQKGYARDLAVLGPDPSGAVMSSAAHAGYIDATLGSASCTAGAWCEKSGFRFTTGGCAKQKQRCDEFVVVATPVSSQSGSRSFCATSDGVVRFSIGPPLTSALSASECQTWPPLQ
jgi:hypothetical protein